MGQRWRRMRGVGGGCIWRRLCRFLVGALGRRFVGVRIDEGGANLGTSILCVEFLGGDVGFRWEGYQGL